MELTTEKITEKLQSIQNRFNRYTFDNKTIAHYITFIEYDKKENRERTEKEKGEFIRIVCGQHYREFVKDYSHVVIAKDKYSKYFIYVKGKNDKLYNTSLDLFVSNRLERTIDVVYDTAEKFNIIVSNKYVTGQIEFPTGNVLFANFFKNPNNDGYAFELKDDEKYSSINSINNELGEQNTMRLLSNNHGLGYVQLGNTSAQIYKVNDDKIIMTQCYLEYYDEEKEKEITISVPEDWELLGEVCCGVWRVEFIDQHNFDKGDTLPLNKYDNFCGQVSPGVWTIKNMYHFMNDDSFLKKGEVPIWVELTRNK